MNTYILYWKHGEKTQVKGLSVSEAMHAACYGAGSISTLAYYSEKDEYEWDEHLRDWVKAVN